MLDRGIPQLTLQRGRDAVLGESQQIELGEARVGPRALLEARVRAVQVGAQLRRRPLPLVGVLREHRGERNRLHEHPVKRRDALHRPAVVHEEPPHRFAVIAVRLLEQVEWIVELRTAVRRPRRERERGLREALARARAKSQAFDGVLPVERHAAQRVRHAVAQHLQRLVGLRGHRPVDPLQCCVHRTARLLIAQPVELLAQRMRQRLVHDEARPVVPHRRVPRVQLGARPLQQQQRMLAPQQPLIERAHERYGAFHAERELRGDDERNARLVQRMREARSGNGDRADVGAVAARDAHHGRAVHAIFADRDQRARESLAGYDVGRAVLAAQNEAVRTARRLVLVAVREDVHVRIGDALAFVEHVGKRRVFEHREELADLLAAARLDALYVVRAKRLDRRRQRLVVLVVRNDIARRRYEQDARRLRPHDAFRRDRADVARKTHRRPRLHGEPALGGRRRPHRHLGELERQVRELRSRQREPQVHERRRAVGIDTERTGQAGHRAKDPAHVDADIVEHRESIGGVSGLIAQLLQAPLERRLLVRHRDDAGAGIAAHREIWSQRRQQLVVRRSRTQELGVDGSNPDRVGHRDAHAASAGCGPSDAAGATSSTYSTSGGRRLQ